MKCLRASLVIFCAATLGLPTVGLATPYPGDETITVDFKLDRQLEEFRGQVNVLLEISAETEMRSGLRPELGPEMRSELRPELGSKLGPELGSEFEYLFRHLELLETSQRALSLGRTIRTEAQIYMHLRLLQSKLKHLSADLESRLGVELGSILSATTGEVSVRDPNLVSTGTGIGTGSGIGSFTGAVTGSDLVSPAGIEGVFVDIFDTNGDWVANAVTDGNGDYTSPALAPGTYYSWTVDWSGYINELYDNVPCYFICTITNDGTPITVNDSSVTPHIDFELDPGGTISGSIKDDNTEALLQDVIVDLFDSTGTWVSNPSTNASGEYRSPGMPADTYYARTFNVDHYQDELYNDIDCPFGCDPAAGTAIGVSVGNDTAGVNFDLVLGGAVSGLVTEQGSGTPIPGPDVWVDIFDAAGNYASVANIEAGGGYTSWRGLPAGTYFARTLNTAGWVNELYSELPCLGWCDVTLGSPIAVVEGSTTAAVNFTMELGGTISGTVVEVGPGPPIPDTPIPDTWVDIFDNDGNFVATEMTDGVGFYQTPVGLPAGDYFARTFAPVGFVNELYNDITCPSFCDPTTGTAIAVVASAMTENIDFDLASGGYISGTITEDGSGLPIAGLPIEGVYVDIFDSGGIHRTWGLSIADGSYVTDGALPPGTYFARTANQLGYSNELYDDLSCHFGCVVTAGSPINVVAGATQENIDFELTSGGVISGTVTEVGTGLPIEDIHVEIWNTNGRLVWWEGTDAAGAFTTTSVLPPGSYFVKTWNDQGYINEIYDDLPCATCDAQITTGTKVTVTTGGTTSGVDFDLAPGGAIGGTVTEEGTGDPLPGIRVRIYSDNGTWVASDVTDAGGHFNTSVGLPTATYYADTGPTGTQTGYINELFEEIPCPGSCDPTTGTPISVVVGNTPPVVDFTLAKGVQITGTVKDAVTDQPPYYSQVQIFNSNGDYVMTSWVGPSGIFTTRTGLPVGTYYAATMNSEGYYDEAYSEIACVGGGEFCPITAATPIVLTAGADPFEIHFTLSPGGWLTGRVVDNVWSTSLAGTPVNIYDSSGDQVGRVTWRRPYPADGSFKSCGLPTGTYYARTDSGSVNGLYTDELFDDIPCPLSCDVTSGDPISVIDGHGTSGIDFRLDFLVFANGFESGDMSGWSSFATE